MAQGDTFSGLNKPGETRQTDSSFKSMDPSAKAGAIGSAFSGAGEVATGIMGAVQTKKAGKKSLDMAYLNRQDQLAAQREQNRLEKIQFSQQVQTQDLNHAMITFDTGIRKFMQSYRKKQNKRETMVGTIKNMGSRMSQDQTFRDMMMKEVGGEK